MTLARYQANLGSPVVPLSLFITTSSWAVNYLRAVVNLIGQSRTQTSGRVFVGVAFLHWELEFRQSSFDRIGRVLRNPLGVAYLTVFRFSLMLCSPHPFQEAFRAMVAVTRMTLLLRLTNKSFLWKRCKVSVSRRTQIYHEGQLIEKKITMNSSYLGFAHSSTCTLWFIC